MTTEATKLVRCDEESLARVVRTAERRLIVIAPSLGDTVTRAIVERWEVLGRGRVSVSLDEDPAHIRAGLGTLTALQTLQQAAARNGGILHRLPNAGITVIVSDDRSIVLPADFARGALHPDKVNCLLANQALFAPNPVAPESNGKAVAGDSHAPRIDEQAVRQVQEDLQRNPPRLDPRLEMIRVFKTEFEFVELELLGTGIERKTARVPAELLGLADNEELRQRMRASFHLIRQSDHSELSGRELTAFKKEIVDELLIQITGYGSVVLHPIKSILAQGVEELRKRVEAHKVKVETDLQAAMDRSRHDLAAALFPAVKERPLKHWRKFGATLDDATVQRLLNEELERAFGTAKNHVGDMRVKATYKGVTAELLSDPEFLKVASQAIPTLNCLYCEFEAFRPARSSENPDS